MTHLIEQPPQALATGRRMIEHDGIKRGPGLHKIGDTCAGAHHAAFKAPACRVGQCRLRRASRGHESCQPLEAAGCALEQLRVSGAYHERSSVGHARFGPCYKGPERAAQALAAPSAGDTTQAGLPRRVPRANLVPGSVGGADDAEADAPVRSPDAARTRMASFQRGVREGRAAAPQTEEP